MPGIPKKHYHEYLFLLKELSIFFSLEHAVYTFDNSEFEIVA